MSKNLKNFLLGYALQFARRISLRNTNLRLYSSLPCRGTLWGGRIPWRWVEDCGLWTVQNTAPRARGRSGRREGGGETCRCRRCWFRRCQWSGDGGTCVEVGFPLYIALAAVTSRPCIVADKMVEIIVHAWIIDWLWFRVICAVVLDFVNLNCVGYFRI